MKKITKVVGNYMDDERATISIEHIYSLTPEHFKVLEILICSDKPDIYRGARRNKTRERIRYAAICELGEMGVVGSHLGDDEKVSHFITEYGCEVTRKIFESEL
jgi:hypothetical protein